MSCRANLRSLVIALALIAAACTASTTTELVESAQEPATEAAPAPATPEPTPAAVTDEASGEDPDGQPTPAVVSTEPDVTEEPTPTEVARAGTVEVLLVDAGAEPRSELRLMIAASCGEILIIEQTQELIQTIDGFDLPSAGVVGTVVESSNSAARVGDNYETQSEIIAAYASAGVAPEIAASMNTELELLVGLATFVTVTDRNVQVPGTFRIVGGEALGPLQSTVESASQAQTPLPIEPVGIGARWETTNVLNIEGAAVTTVTEYLITNREGTLVDMQVSAIQTVAPGSQMNLLGVLAEITEWSGITTGEATIDLATMGPIRSVFTSQATQGFSAEGEGLLIQEIQSEVIMTSEPNAGCTGRTTRP